MLSIYFTFSLRSLYQVKDIFLYYPIYTQHIIMILVLTNC